MRIVHDNLAESRGLSLEGMKYTRTLFFYLVLLSMETTEVASGLISVRARLAVIANMRALKLSYLHLLLQLDDLFLDSAMMSKRALSKPRILAHQRFKNWRTQPQAIRLRDLLSVDNKKVRQLLVGRLLVLLRHEIRQATSRRWPGHGKASLPYAACASSPCKYDSELV